MLERWAPAWVVISVLFGPAGCKEEKQDCAYWTTRLSQPASAEKALGEVEDLGCVEAIPELAKLFEQGMARDRVLRILKRLGDPDKAAPILKKALLTEDLGKSAAVMVADWKLAAARPELEEVLKSPTLGAQRELALKALLSFEPPAKIEALLIALAQDDADLQGIAVNRLAAEKLGELASPAAVPALIRAAYLRSQLGERALAVARKALVRIDPDVIVPALLAVFQNRDPAFNAWAAEHGLAEWEWTSSPETVQLLMDQLDPRATPALVASLAARNITPSSPPAGVTPATREKWFQAQLTRLQLIWLATGHLGGDDPSTVLAPLVALLLDVNAPSFQHQRLRAANILANLGTKAGVDALFAAFPQLESLDAKAPAIIPLAEATGPEQVAAFDALFKDNESKTLQQQLDHERTRGSLAVARECLDQACLLERLSSADKWQVLKAASLLARGVGDREKAVAALIARFGKTSSEDEDIRRWCAMGLTRLGDASTGPKLLALAESLEGPRDAGWKAQLELFGHALARRK